MRIFIAIVAKADNGSTPGDRAVITERAKIAANSFINRTFPSREKESNSDSWTNSRGDSSLMGWTNETIDQNNPLITRIGDVAIARSGYLAGEIRESDFASIDDPLEISAKAGGCFSIIRADSHSIQSVTDVTRSGGLYWATNALVTVVSTRALFTRLVAESVKSNTRNPALDFDLFSLRTMGSVGHFLGNETPFPNVKALDAASCLRIDPWFVRQTSLPPVLEIEQAGNSTEWHSTVANMSDLLVAAYEPAEGSPANLSLTGGRDSRLLAASIVRNPRMNTSAATSGISGHPDVDLAVVLAAKLGIPHRVVEPAGLESQSLLRVEHPLERIIRVLDVHDGMTSAWDDIPDYGPMSMKPTISGVGGEILRGGIVAQNLESLGDGHASRQIKNAMAGSSGLFNKEWMEQADAFAQPMMELAEREPYQAADAYYHLHRNGRWVSARRSGARFRAFPVDPLLDNRLVRLALNISPQVRWSERLVFDMINHLEPQLRDIPLEGSRWRFERFSAWNMASSSERETWDLRYGIQAPPRVGGYSWQSLKDEGIRSMLKEIVMDRMTGDVAKLFDKPAVEKLFEGGAPRWPATIWSIATTAVLLSDNWHDSSRPEKNLSVVIDPSVE